MKFIFRIYQALIHNAYVLEHKKSNHHYIPRFLLKKFNIPNTGQVFQYTYLKEPERVSIEKEAACIENLYSIKDKNTKSKSDFLENQVFAFSLEKYASRIINQIIKTEDVELTNLERSIIVSFLSFQYVRTPKFLHIVRLVLEYLNLQKNVTVNEMIEENFYRKAFFENYYKITPQEVGKFGLSNGLSLTNADNLILKISIQIGNHLSNFIHKKDFRLLIARDPAFFYLSDSPMDIFNIEQDRSMGPFLWELNGNPLIFMPICKNLCLYALDSKGIPPPHVIGGMIQDFIPKGVYQFAFSDRKSDQIQSIFNK